MPEIKYNGENTLTRVIEKTIDYVDTKTAPIDSKLNANLKGAANGVAELDESGKVPSAQLPSYVDDIVDCYYDTETEKLYETKDGNTYSDEITPEGGKIYVDKDSNAAYRWTGSIIASVGSANAITLGETSSTAYRGDRGKIAYDDSQANKAAIGDITNLTTETKSNLVGAVNEVKTEVDKKVTAVTGKGLSTNDYDNTEKAEVAKVKDKQNKELSSAVTIDGISKSSVEEAISALTTLANATSTMALNKISVADVFDSTEEYAIGDYCIYDNKLYKAKAVHQGDWDADNFEEKKIMDEIVSAMVSDYESLLNQPQIAGVTLVGNKTYSELGIQQSESGKGLSTNDYSDEAKAIVDGVTAALAAKQPKTLETAVTIEGASKTTVQQVADAVGIHTGRSVTDNTGAHGLKVESISEDEDAIYYKSGNDWKQIQLGSVTQLEEVPTAAAKYVGKIYQYVGTTTQTYKKGYFYECVNSAGNYSWREVRVQSGGGQTIQYDPLPTAEAKLVGALYQYVGTTNANYTKGYFYECMAQGTSPETYAWVQVNEPVAELTAADIEEIKAQWAPAGGDINEKQDKFQYALIDMPEASAANAGKVVQYIGATNLTYTHNYFYECVLDGVSYIWQETFVQSGANGQTIQVDELPTASEDYVGDVYQYVGNTTLTYTQNYFYKCRVVPDSSPVSYEWINVSVQPTPVTTFSDQDIADIKAAFDRGLAGTNNNSNNSDPNDP